MLALGAVGMPERIGMNAVVALTFLMLVLSMRLARWERIDVRTAHRAKFSRVLAGFAALLAMTNPTTPVLLSAGTSMLAVTLTLQAYGKELFIRRILLTVSVITGTWLVLANLYAVSGRISPELTADPTSALALMMLSLSLGLEESRSGLIPISLKTVLGARDSVRLLLAALLVPVMLGYWRMHLEQFGKWDSRLLLALHVMATLGVMAVLLVGSLNQARERIEEERRTRADLEASENALQQLLEQGSEFYLTMNLAGRVLSANENSKRYLGLPDLKKHVVVMEDLVARESHDKMRKLPEAVLRGSGQQDVLLFRLSDGELLPLLVTAAGRARPEAGTEIVIVGHSMPLGLRPPETSQALLVKAS